MIRTIGALVQEPSRARWRRAVSLYVFACTGTAALLGALLGCLGLLVRHLFFRSTYSFYDNIVSIAIGALAIAYALSDAGLLALPRPTLMLAVPVSWWRWWRPYGAALAYGAALGIGLTTRIFFGAFYVLCAYCILAGNSVYGALLIGTYGFARAIIIIPASRTVYASCTNSEARLNGLLASLTNAKLIVALPLILFGTLLIVSAIL
jgi:hypothetical protein